jgi:hypothetical protein
MSSILIEVAAWLLGDAISGRIPSAPTPEGAVNASLGAVAAFLGFVSVMVAIPAVVFPFGRGHFGLDAILLATTLLLVVTACGSLGILAARRALRVTGRNLALAKLGHVASIVAISGCVVGLLVTAARALL